MKAHTRAALEASQLEKSDNRLIGILMSFGLILLVLALSGCGGGGSGGDGGVSASGSDTGELVLALTDAEGDFVSYVVDITSINMVHQNGSVVETLPLSTTVDFAQYVELSELLTIATVPSGAYQSVQLNLDYSNANVVVQAEDGSLLNAELVDSDGNELTQLAVTIELSSASRFVIAPGIPAQVTLDLDLDASNEVVIENGQAIVTVEPILLADTLFETPKPFRLRGLLNEVATEEEVISIDLLPFRHRQRGFGSVRIHVDDETRYQIDGVDYSADEGLQQLATKEADTPIVSGGEWDRDSKEFTANVVYAGSSVMWSDANVMRGVVIAREENSLTVRGAVIEFSDGGHVVRDTMTVLVGPETLVSKQLQGVDNVSIADISVGSAITVSGEIVDDTTLDASTGRVRIKLSNVIGSVVSASPLSIDVQRLSARSVAIYDFSGTGTDTASDADPDNYEIDTSVLSLGSLAIGEPIKVRGQVSAFGSAPEDFIAQTVLDAGDVKGHMLMHFARDGVETALAQYGDDGLLFDISDAEGRTVIIRAGIVTQLADVDTMPLVVPAADEGVFAITRRGRIEVYRQFGEFATALGEALAAGETVTRFDAHGQYDAELNQFMSSRLRIGLIQ
jgi:hypothetical protein